MSQSLSHAQDILLSPAELSLSQLQPILDRMMTTTVDHADLYFQFYQNESWSLDEGIIKSASYDRGRGVGVRIISGEKTGFAYSDELQLTRIEQAVDSAKSILTHGGRFDAKPLKQSVEPSLYLSDNPLILPDSDKVALLKQVEAEARRLDPLVKRVTANLSGNYEVVLVAAANGELAADIRPLVRLGVSVIVEQNGRREQGYYGGGGRCGYDYFLQQQDNLPLGLSYAREAVREALLNLEAGDALAGLMPVVLGPGWSGVLLHEAIGHGLEGDFNRKGSSAFSQLMGQRVASSLCTIVDNGSLANRRGSLNIDDEGVPSQCTTLIEQGVLKAYMQDKHNAHLMNTVSTGNGRRESYATPPLPRMTNTYMLPGPHQPEEIIASVKKGLYAANFSGGEVDITNGKFVFSANEAYLIENGKIARPVKGAMLIGDGATVLSKVSMVGNDLKLDSGVGVCGKNGQSVPVGVGQPTLLVDELTVGGTKTGGQ